MPHRFLLGCLLGMGITLGMLVIGQHVSLNLTPSLPRGVYLRQAVGTIHRGALVAFTAPDRWVEVLSAIPGWQVGTPLLKRVAAIAGDTVCGEGATFVINPPWPAQGCRLVQPGELVVIGTHPHSFDSRQAGPIDVRRIQATLTPLLTW
jgi:type IV secretory pathway protease TraF